MQLTPRTSTALFTSAVVVALASPAGPVSAHTGHALGGLGAGLSHPLLGVDHVFAMVSVGILGVVLRRPLLAPGIFVGALAASGAAAMAGLRLPGVEAAIALSVVALGAAIVAARTLRADVTLGLIGVAGVLHGHAHGSEAPTAAHPAVYIAGFVAATVALHAAGLVSGRWIVRGVAARSALGAVVIGAGLGLTVGLV